MILPAVFAGKAGNERNRRLHAACLDLSYSVDQLLSRLTLADVLQDFITSRLSSDVDHRKTCLVKLTHLLVSLLENVCRSSVYRHSLTLRKVVRYIFQDRHQPLVGKRQRVTVAQKHPFDSAVPSPCPCQIFEHLIEIPDPEFLVLEHFTERALVMRTSYSDLHQQAVCLAGRSVYISLVSHSLLLDICYR